MSTESARRDVELIRILETVSLTNGQTLAVHLLHEVSKAGQSFWRPYIDALPPHYPVLAAFSAEVTRELQVMNDLLRD